MVNVARRCGGGRRKWQAWQTRMLRFSCYFPRPSLSGLFWRRAGRHNDLVDVTLTAEVSLRGVSRIVGTGTSFLMMVLPLVAGRACVPDGHVIPTGVAVVVVIVPLVRVGLAHVCALPFAVGIRWRDARNGRGRNGEWRGGGWVGVWRIVCTAPAAPTATACVTSATIIPILASWRRRIARVWSGGLRRDSKECKLLLGGCQCRA
jgi:hypothetical protein